MELETVTDYGQRAGPFWRMNIMKKMNRITALVVAGVISCTSPMMVMASDSSSVMSQAEEILKDNEIESLASDPDKVGDIIVYVKGLFDSNQISDDEISQGIDEAADHYGVTLSEDDKNSLVNIISKFRGIDISDDQIKGYVSDAYSTLKDMGVTKSDVKNIFEKAIEFIKGMLSRQQEEGVQNGTFIGIIILKFTGNVQNVQYLERLSIKQMWRFYKKRGKTEKKLCKHAKSSRAVHNLFIFI